MHPGDRAALGTIDKAVIGRCGGVAPQQHRCSRYNNNNNSNKKPRASPATVQ